MLRLALFSLFIAALQSYPFCPKCVHYYTSVTSYTKPCCNLFRNHTLFKDRNDVDFIGMEICTVKGKYFKTIDEEYIVAS